MVDEMAFKAAAQAYDDAWEYAGKTEYDYLRAGITAYLAALKAQEPVAWVHVPKIGARVKSSHPITCLNPDEYFEVSDVKRDERDRYWVRGEKTCWFALAMITPEASPPPAPDEAREGVEVLLEAAQIIAGERQCLDNLMGHRDVAIEALRLYRARSARP